MKAYKIHWRIKKDCRGNISLLDKASVLIMTEFRPDFSCNHLDSGFYTVIFVVDINTRRYSSA